MPLFFIANLSRFLSRATHKLSFIKQQIEETHWNYGPKQQEKKFAILAFSLQDRR
ncbi:hypothetical protein JCM10512_3776 [Bacteroides reticulotermitis JCM 10512]|uniref:Uncharacterized protein n=1 Tax=Bacteroides reticulotermitis JCM 10512 TaxID=1445607 RepID=W4UXX5_9BACE|nr:hypothetical protein JCM10512_3776 [Bacteroides reticulotermitis JCM 10512]